MNPAARLTDVHACPQVTPAIPPVPHVGGPISGPGVPSVLIGSLPARMKALRESLNALGEDHGFLLKGDVFTQDVIDTWITYKMENEVRELDLRPHPWEFAMYYDI